MATSISLACVAGAILSTATTTEAQPQPPTVHPSVAERVAQLRVQFADPKYKFHPVVTGVSHRPLGSITGGHHMSDAQIRQLALTQNSKAAAWLAEEKKNMGARWRAPDASCAHASHYDLRAKGYSSPVQDQGTCGLSAGATGGSCWDYAAVASLESSWKMLNGQDIGASEQHVLNCAQAAGSCPTGGTSSSAFIFLQFTGIPQRNQVPFAAPDGARHGCNNEMPKLYSVGTWGFVGTVQPSTSDLKQSICEHGSIAAAMNATPAFQNYGMEGDIFNEQANAPFTDHYVSIIGWDDAKHAWLIKNSWGTSWGIKAGDPSPNATAGYAWIDYSSNDIGRYAAWAHARRPCPNGGEYDAGLCYQACRRGYHGLGPMCWENCPAGMVDDGATCRAPIEIHGKRSHGRGVGTPLTCGPNEEQSGLLCYPACPANYAGAGPVCRENCKPGYHDDGLTCRRDAQIIGADNSSCPWSNKCSQFGAHCSHCPAGYINDGCTCRINADIYAKPSQGRGVGSVLHACPAGTEKSGLLCYPSCQTGFTGVGPICWENCPPGYTDTGALCDKGGQVTASKGYGRGVGTMPP